MQIDWASARKILIVKLSSLGDLVHVTPVLRVLRRAAPQARIHFAVESRFAAVLRHDPNLDGIIEADGARHGWLSRVLDARRALARHTAPRFDIALDFQGRWRSALWVYMSQARIRAGRGGARPGWHHAVRPDMSRHAVHVCAEVAEAMGLAVPDRDPGVHTSPVADVELEAMLNAAGLPREGFVVINPYSRWRSKEWPMERYAELLRRLTSLRNRSLVLSGGKDRRADAERLLARLPHGSVTSLVGRLTLEQAICLYRRARFMLTGDSGPMHIAAALGTPLIALFGPTFPEQTGPWGSHCRVIQARRPTHHHAYLTDHRGEHVAAITVDCVHAAVLEALFEMPGRMRAA
jgi:lipopolysaccharide heptosyltransferase I